MKSIEKSVVVVTPDISTTCFYRFFLILAAIISIRQHFNLVVTRKRYLFTRIYCLVTFHFSSFAAKTLFSTVNFKYAALFTNAPYKRVDIDGSFSHVYPMYSRGHDALSKLFVSLKYRWQGVVLRVFVLAHVCLY